MMPPSAAPGHDALPCTIDDAEAVKTCRREGKISARPGAQSTATSAKMARANLRIPRRFIRQVYSHRSKSTPTAGRARRSRRNSRAMICIGLFMA